MGSIFRLGMHRRAPVQFTKDNTGGTLQVQAAGCSEGNAQHVRMAGHEAFHRLRFFSGCFPARNKARREALQLLPVHIHHRMMMGKQQYFFAAVQQHTDKLAHVRCLGNPGGLPCLLGNTLL